MSRVALDLERRVLERVVRAAQAHKHTLIARQARVRPGTRAANQRVIDDLDTFTDLAKARLRGAR